MPTYALTVDGAAAAIQAGTLRISERLNGRNNMSFDVESLTGAFNPEWGDAVIYTEDSYRLFGGTVETPAERGIFSTGGTPIMGSVSVADHNALAERRVIDVTIPAGTLKAALVVLTTYLSSYGVTLDGAQVNGPSLSELVYHFRPLREVLDELSVLTGYIWEIDYSKVLRMFLPGSSAASFNVVPAVDPSVVIGDIAVETIREDYANRVLFLAGTGLKDVSESFVGDSSNREFALTVPVSGYPSVTVNGNPVTVGIHGVDTAYEWTYRALGNAIVQLADAPPGTAHSPLTSGDTLVVNYAGNHPFLKQADDAAEQAAQGLWEVVIEDTAVFDHTIAQALADAHLARRLTSYKSVTYETERNIRPGQTQTITVPDRDLSGTFLVTDVETSDLANRFRRRVKAIGGTTLRGSWRDLYRQWGGTRSGGSSVSAVVSTGSAPLPTPAFLGGSRNTSVPLNPAAYTPVPDFVTFTAQASFSGRVRADAWARDAGISCTLRLRNLTDSTTTGTASAVTSQTPTERTIDVSITAGKTYRLEMLSSANSAGVFGIGVLESV